jgi:hypothetical protein
LGSFSIGTTKARGNLGGVYGGGAASCAAAAAAAAAFACANSSVSTPQVSVLLKCQYSSSVSTPQVSVLLKCQYSSSVSIHAAFACANSSVSICTFEPVRKYFCTSKARDHLLLLPQPLLSPLPPFLVLWAGAIPEAGKCSARVSICRAPLSCLANVACTALAQGQEGRVVL